MKPYGQTARFYDAALGDRTDTAAYIRHLIVQNKPDAKTLLEIACGTGAILKLLAKSYEVVGVDVSPQMLSTARKKLPRAALFQQDMVTLNLKKKFDVVICVFDSINHVLRFSDWKKVFRRAALHLHSQGLFVFDINTVEKLQRRLRTPASIHSFGRNKLILSVTDAGDGIAVWHIKILENRGRRHSRKTFAEDIKQVSFPIRRIRAGLRDYFTKITVIDPIDSKPSAKSDRIYFVCKK
jgi:ubiquinone/menaquinone biosynthesis C-methylase UbiE